MTMILVRGTGDVGSAVAHALFLAGYRVILHDTPEPLTSRRKMAFTDAIFDGRAELAGLVARRVDDLALLDGVLSAHEEIPVMVCEFAALVATTRPDVLVDARMRKRVQPEAQIGLAHLSIGLGPNFDAGETTDLAIETSWGEDLGNIVERGPTRPLEGEPRPIAGHARDRYIYAPADGVWHTDLEIGEPVHPGQVVAFVDSTPVVAQLRGVLRGLTRDGVKVSRGTKVVEVDPRGLEAVLSGIGERPGRIADGVLRGVQLWERSQSTSQRSCVAKH